jgi:EAL domain-containing protein (putative c-di-GMP-specific phosphodiesterase class I)
VSMDDFGTGYSSLTQLHQFPFDKLKIDRSFVARIGRSTEGLAIIRAIARMGASLGLRTVAEGVETIEQWDMLKAEGCDEVQGYLLGRPTQACKLVPLLQNYTSPQPA